MVREKLAGVIRTLLYVMVLFVEFLAVNRYRQIHGKIQKKYYRKTEKSKEMLMSCSPRLATTVELGLCVWPYTVYAK
jgi:hypothetical protein